MNCYVMTRMKIEILIGNVVAALFCAGLGWLLIEKALPLGVLPYLLICAAICAACLAIARQWDKRSAAEERLKYPGPDPQEADLLHRIDPSRKWH